LFFLAFCKDPNNNNKKKTTHHYLYPKDTLIIHVFLHLSIKNTKAIRGEKLKYPRLQKKEGPERDAKNIGG